MSTNTSYNAGAAIGRFFFGVLLYIVAIPVRGYVIVCFWQWFIVPIWGWSPLSVVHAIGLSITTSLFTIQIPRERDDDTRKYTLNERLGQILILHGIMLLTGWLLHETLRQF